MADEKTPKSGTVAWQDLTVPDAPKLRDFHAAVVGWRPEPVDMGGYADFNMVAPATGKPAAGVCHARGANAKLPAQWLIYVVVDDLEGSLRRCLEQGGVDVLVREVVDADAVRARSTSPGGRERILAHHTTPEQAAEVFARVRPRLAVYSHASNAESVMTQARRTYAGPLQGPEDMLTIEIGEKIDVRHLAR